MDDSAGMPSADRASRPAKFVNNNAANRPEITDRVRRPSFPIPGLVAWWLRGQLGRLPETIALRVPGAKVGAETFVQIRELGP